MQQLVVEFLLRVLDDREGRRRDRAGSAHDEPLAIRGYIELEVARRTIRRGSFDPKETLGLAKLQSTRGWRYTKPVVETNIEEFPAVRSPPSDPGAVPGYLPFFTNQARRGHRVECLNINFRLTRLHGNKRDPRAIR